MTRPDAPAGRGRNVKPSPVGEFAASRGWPVLKPERLDGEFVASLAARRPDLLLVFAYGKILPSAVLGSPRIAPINLHLSPLPKYRGPAPIQRAIWSGETETGFTYFWMDEGCDTGDILLQRSLPIEPEDDAKTLTEKLVVQAAAVLPELLKAGQEGKLAEARRPQRGEPSYAPRIRKEEARLDWSLPAEILCRRIRALAAGPVAYTFGPSGERLLIHRARPWTSHASSPSDPSVSAPVVPNTPPGTIVSVVGGEGFTVRCGEGLLLIQKIQKEGRQAQEAPTFWRGAGLRIADRLGVSPV